MQPNRNIKMYIKYNVACHQYPEAQWMELQKALNST